MPRVPAKQPRLLSHDVDAGTAAFCSTCARLFRYFPGTDDDPTSGKPRCSDCTGQAQFRESLEMVGDRSQQPQRRGSTLSKWVALHNDLSAPRDQVARPSDSLVSHDDAATSALHQIVDSLRRQNRELTRRLSTMIANGTRAVDDPVDAAATSSDSAHGSGGGGGGKSGRRFDSAADELEALKVTLGAFIPAPKLATSRYAPLYERLNSLSVVWREHQVRLAAMHAALLGSEATCATLQEELLIVENSQATLGQVVKSQSAELEEVRRREHLAEESLAEHGRAEAFAHVSRDEAESLLRGRQQAEAQLRQQVTTLHRSLEDAHASLESFVTQQQGRRARELQSRQKQLAAWDGQLLKLLKLLELTVRSDGAKGQAARAALAVSDDTARAGASGRPGVLSSLWPGRWPERSDKPAPGDDRRGDGEATAEAYNAGAATLRGLVESMSTFLRGAMEEHASALRAMGASSRDFDALDRASYERQIELLSTQLNELQAVRFRLSSHLEMAIGERMEAQLELLKKQRDEAFKAREIAVDSLRQHVVREGQMIMALRSGFEHAADELRLAFQRIPLTDESLAANRTEHERLHWVADVSRRRMIDGALDRWRLRFLRAHWVGWRGLVLQAKVHSLAEDAHAYKVRS